MKRIFEEEVMGGRQIPSVSPTLDELKIPGVMACTYPHGQCRCPDWHRGGSYCLPTPVWRVSVKKNKTNKLEIVPSLKLEVL